VYRTEIGTDVGGGVVALDNHERVARLSDLLWGTAPTPDLLDRAGGSELSDDDVAALVDEMLADPRGIRQMRVFHELWLRYTSLLITDPALAADMGLETSALVDRALAGVSATGDWRQLFTSTETFVSPALATHYGLSAPAEAGWVSYNDGRVGLLSHGSFLSLSETKLTETLPSRRGAMIGRRLLCEVIMPPPPDVAVDMGVTVPEGSCKADAYEAHATGTCKGCHQTIDGIGFGFERYDGVGRYREVEEANPTCSIEGAGTYNGQTFSGPSDFVAQNLDQISECAATNLVKFAIRDWGASDDQIERISFAFEESHYDFGALMRAVAIDASFRHRVNEEASQ
jgi:hypothetical protein